ncbi:MAG: hypothetical protein AAF628_20790 [Planctomycetota bacterium]
MSLSATSVAAHFAAATLLTTWAASQALHVVDAAGGPAATFTTLPGAVAAAAPGDTLLVRTGSYGQVTIAKPLAVVADRGASVRVTNLEIRDLAPNDLLLIRGLTVAPSLDIGLCVLNSAGVVWFEDCSFDSVGSKSFATTPAVWLDHAGTVTAIRCTARAGAPVGLGLPASPAVLACNSTLHLFDSFLKGGVGTSSFIGSATAGGAGLDVRDASIFVQSSTIEGGDGGPGLFVLGCVSGGDGGVGALLNGTSSTLRHVATTFVGGPGGTAPPSCAPGATGTPTQVVAGTVEDLGGPSHALTAGGPTREGETLTLSVDGPPGDAVSLWFAARSSPALLPLLRGPFLLDPVGLGGFVLGTIPASGTLSVAFPAPALPAGVAVGQGFAQVIALSPLQGAVTGSGAALLWLPASV